MFLLSPAMQGSAYCSEIFLPVLSLLTIHFLLSVLNILDDVSQSFFDASEIFLYWFIEKIVVSLDFVVFFLAHIQIFSHLPLLIFSVLIGLMAENF